MAEVFRSGFSEDLDGDAFDGLENFDGKVQAGVDENVWQVWSNGAVSKTWKRFTSKTVKSNHCPRPRYASFLSIRLGAQKRLTE